ncbi:MAG: hypothetical protein ABI543_03250 [Ignavibacteria bacterium]
MNKVQKTIIAFSALITVFFFSHAAYSQNCLEDVLCAKFASQSVNQLMEPGTSQNVTVKFKMSNSTSWVNNTIELVYVDTRMNPENNNVWGVDKIKMQPSEDVVNGAGVFQFTITAPKKPGIYNFQWQISSNGTLIGYSSPSTEITVK